MIVTVTGIGFQTMIDKISAKNISQSINNAFNLFALFFILFNMYLSLFSSNRIRRFCLNKIKENNIFSDYRIKVIRIAPHIH